jgi:Lrp/AsnC family leucine-responsive transcriptional regulator
MWFTVLCKVTEQIFLIKVSAEGVSPMPPATTLSLDPMDCKILMELQKNARVTFAEIGRHVALSTPAVIERVRRLEESGVIEGYHARINPAKVGFTVRALVKISIAGDQLTRFGIRSQKVPEVLECHRVTGTESFILQIAATDVAHMERIIDQLMPYVATNTSIILGSPVSWSPILLPQA